MGFPENLKRIRQLRGIGAAELADRIGVSRTNIYNWEGGKNQPDVENLTRLSKELNTTINELMADEPAGESGDIEKAASAAIRPEDVYKKIVEGNTEYFLVPKTAFEGKHRFIPIEQLETNSQQLQVWRDQLAKKDEQLERQMAQIVGLTEMVKELTTGFQKQLSKAQEGNKDTGVGNPLP